MPIFENRQTYSDADFASLPSEESGTQGVSIDIPLRGVPLYSFVHTGRSSYLDRMESYFRGTQDNAKPYDWDGNFSGYKTGDPIGPGWRVPYKNRRPAARYDLPRVIVNRYTALLFGADRFPQIRVEGDLDAEDFARCLCEVSRMPMRVAELRNIGGSVGGGGLSFAFVNGRPRTEVHNAKHITVLRWVDESEWEAGAVLKAYSYTRRVFDRETKKLKEATFYYARYWDEEKEIVWQPMPEIVAKSEEWYRHPSKIVRHNFGFTPFYWVQNKPNSTEPDGYSDYDGLCDNFDEINQILSAASKGTKANCDPTLVIKMDPTMNTGAVFKGSENAIYSPGGAEYLEISGNSVEAAKEMLEKLRSYVLDATSVVLHDADKPGSQNAASADSMRVRFMPMLAEADILREQYGDYGIEKPLKGMVKAAKILMSRPSQVVQTDEGEKELIYGLNLPKKTITETNPTTGELTIQRVDRKPGESEEIILNWNPYFPPTYQDIKAAVEGISAATVGKQLLSQRTGVQAVQSLFGIQSVDNELQLIQEDQEASLEMAKEAMAIQEPDPGYNGSKSSGDEE